MKVIGLGLEDLSTYWSKNGKDFTPEEPALHIKIRVPKQRSWSIPTKPPVLILAWKELPQLGTKAPEVVAMYASCLETSDEFGYQARRKILERGSVGVHNRYSNMQSTSAPAIDKGLILKRLEICLQYFINYYGTEIWYIQGEGILVSDGENITKKQCRQAWYKSGESVMIFWGK